MEHAEVPSDNVLVRNEATYSIADRRDDRGILAVDVRVELEELLAEVWPHYVHASEGHLREG